MSEYVTMKPEAIEDIRWGNERQLREIDKKRVQLDEQAEAATKRMLCKHERVKFMGGCILIQYTCQDCGATWFD